MPALVAAAGVAAILAWAIFETAGLETVVGIVSLALTLRARTLRIVRSIRRARERRRGIQPEDRERRRAAREASRRASVAAKPRYGRIAQGE